MTVSTQGIALKSPSRAVRASVELLSSMRFSISLLTVICIASAIGTVLKQGEPYNNYVNQFGSYWAEVFNLLSLYNIYSAWWFLTILGFLVTSTTLCLLRNTPKIVADLKTYKENIREQSLQAFGQRAQAALAESPQSGAERVQKVLKQAGWRIKLQARDTPHGPGWMLAAKAGGANKLGYIAAHSAIVLICIGGLLDGDLIVRAQMLLQGKTLFNGTGMVGDVTEQHRLGENNPTFRGNLLVAEGTQSSTAVLSQSQGVVLQELPFSVELKKFIVEYYSTGMPKLFASDIVIHDKATGEARPARVEVNHPVQHRGIEIYQSSFDDGGSQVRFKALPFSSPGQPFTLEGTIGGSAPLPPSATPAQGPMTVEYTGLRVINVENLGQDSGSATDPRKVDLRTRLNASLGAANKANNEQLRNVGPSVSYKLRDAAGQAVEFNNYMQPVEMGDGVGVFLLGMRNSPAESFRYLRIPADGQGSMEDFFRLRHSLLDPSLRALAAKRYANRAIAEKNPALTQQLALSAERTLNLFANAPTDAASDTATGSAPSASLGASTGKTAPSTPVAGLQALSDFIERNVVAGEREKASEVLIHILNGCLFELLQLSRARDGLPAIASDRSSEAFMTQSVLALSDAPLYPAPVLLQLVDFTHVQASVFQVTRTPGKNVVYIGCALLILGIFAMLYVRERRLWIWFSPDTAQPPQGSHCLATMAMSSNRKTMDADQEFVRLKTELLGLTQSP